MNFYLIPHKYDTLFISLGCIMLVNHHKIITCYINFNSNIHVAVKLGVGGFSMGAATALYSASCFTAGKYGNGNAYPANLSAAVGLSGWLPCAKSDLLSLL